MLYEFVGGSMDGERRGYRLDHSVFPPRQKLTEEERKRLNIIEEVYEIGFREEDEQPVLILREVR